MDSVIRRLAACTSLSGALPPTASDPCRAWKWEVIPIHTRSQRGIKGTQGGPPWLKYQTILLRMGLSILQFHALCIKKCTRI